MRTFLPEKLFNIERTIPSTGLAEFYKGIILP